MAARAWSVGPRLRWGVLAAAVALVGGTAVVGAQSAGEIRACVAPKGDVRIVGAGVPCGKDEQLLTWSIQGVQGPAGPSGAQGPAGPAGPAATALFAVVNQDGSLFANSGVVSAQKLCPTCRQYNVTFNRDVSRCAALATIGGNPSFQFQQTGELQVFTGPLAGPNVVSVIHHDSGGGADSSGVNFHLAVFC